MLEITLFDNFRVVYNETPIKEINTPRLQSLLAYLVLHSGLPLPRNQIASLFWPETTEPQARTNLRNLIHHLRRILPDADSFLDCTIQTLQWRSDSPFSLDVLEFRSALRRAEQFRKEGAADAEKDTLEKAVDLYKGDMLPTCFDEWIFPLREEYRQSYLAAEEKLAAFYERQQNYQASIRYTQQMLSTDPLQESTYQKLMHLYTLNGDRAGALRTYHACTTVLLRELDVEPADETRQMYLELMGTTNLTQEHSSAAASLSRTIGREKEWGEILNTWREVSKTGGPFFIALSGEAGIGKTRLVEDMLRWVSRQGITTLSTRCYAAEGELAYAPVVSWLRSHPLPPMEEPWLSEVGRLLPEVLASGPDLPQPPPLTEPWQRLRLFEALSKAILGTPQPLLLSIDDLQWCDPDTLKWLHFLLRYDHSARILLIGSYRPEEIDGAHPLNPFLHELRSTSQILEIELAPLDERETHKLAIQLTGKKISETQSRWLYQLTEGNPLFVVETLRSGLPIQEQSANNSTNWIAASHGEKLETVSLPSKVASILKARLAHLSPSSNDLVGAAATIGREFSFRLLQAVSGHGEMELVHELDELWRYRILREQSGDSYDFTHDRLREVAYLSMSTIRQRFLHSRTAESLLALHKSDPGPVCLQIAVHFEKADKKTQAIPYFLKAAQMSRQVFANDEAIALLRHGLELISEVSQDSEEKKIGNNLAARFWEALGDVLELAARHTEAFQAFVNALSLSLPTDNISQARLQRKKAVVLKQQRSYTEALRCCSLAEAALKDQQDDNSAEWWDEWLDLKVEKAWTLYWLANWSEMDEIISQVRPVVEKRGSLADRVRLLWVSCLMHLRKERYTVSDDMLSESREALQLSLDWSDYSYITSCQFELGFLHLWRRNLLDAEQNLLKALKLVDKSGEIPIRTLCLTYLTVVHRFKGDVVETEQYANRALAGAIKASMPDYIAAAKGNLAWLAFRKKDWAIVERLGHEALDIWQKSPLVYPFQWLALWPLLASAWAQNNAPGVTQFANNLLEPTQQIMPLPLSQGLASMTNSPSSFSFGEMEKMMSVAEEMGYL